MATTQRTLRLVTGTALTLGMAALWAGSIYHYGSADASPADMVADAQANPGALLVDAVSSLLETVLLTIAAIGVAAIVRGRGRTFVLVACGVLAVGLPSHVMGATMHLTMHELATSSLPTDVQVSVVDGIGDGLGAVYFALIVPFLLGMILLTAALWRARVVGWQPFAILVADIAFGMTVNGSHTPSDWMWWIDPIVTIAAFAWLAVGLTRYRPDEPEPVEPSERPVLAAA